VLGWLLQFGNCIIILRGMFALSNPTCNEAQKRCCNVFWVLDKFLNNCLPLDKYEPSTWWCYAIVGAQETSDSVCRWKKIHYFSGYVTSVGLTYWNFYVPIFLWFSNQSYTNKTSAVHWQNYLRGTLEEYLSSVLRNWMCLMLPGRAFWELG
jgi:hypothetical protein